MNAMTERRILHAHFHLERGTEPDLYGQLLALAEDITPRVQPIPPDAAHLDITGALRYWQRDAQGLAALLRLRTLALYGVQVTCAIAPNRIRRVRRFPQGMCGQLTALRALNLCRTGGVDGLRIPRVSKEREDAVLLHTRLRPPGPSTSWTTADTTKPKHRPNT
ncbi:hypothetical protein ACFQ7O_03635 [Streptomyces sp. NPDC056485]|uniref:hypothetical protein n=1 Tax=Streptomyces sp. NPDC056485 TaxID=3345834 RepID=UPI00367427A0